MGLLDRIIVANARPRAEIEAEKLAARQKQEAMAKAAEEIFATHTGEIVQNKGVYLCCIKVLDKPEDPQKWIAMPDDKRVGSLWDIWAPEKNPLDPGAKGVTLNYVMTKERLKQINNGESYENSADIGAALCTGSYKGGLFIPPLELLDGTDIDDNHIAIPNLYACKIMGGLCSLVPDAGMDEKARRYWSSTPQRTNPMSISNIDVVWGTSFWSSSVALAAISCLPMRAERAEAQKMLYSGSAIRGCSNKIG